jgi:hypothetical protein
MRHQCDNRVSVRSRDGIAARLCELLWTLWTTSAGGFEPTDFATLFASPENNKNRWLQGGLPARVATIGQH